MMRILEYLGSLRLAVVGMVLLFLLVTVATLAQVKLGIHGAVEAYIRSLLVWSRVPGTGIWIPIFPGGGLIGALLIVNMTASLIIRGPWNLRKGGLALVHIGVILLIVGEFQAAFLSHETRMAIEEGTSRNYTEDGRAYEFAVEEKGATAAVVPEASVARGGELAAPGLPVSFKATGYHRNAHLVMGGKGHGGAKTEAKPGPAATAGSGRALRVIELEPATGSDESDSPAAFIEVSAGGKVLGTWLVSPGLGSQEVATAGRKFALSLRPARTMLPFTLTLKDFRHEVYPGTDIPRNFASLMRLVDAERHEDRDVLVWMNHPLRHRGLTFYQASYGKGDTVSILQVVRNPGWLLPYLACLLVSAGMAWHFLRRLLPGSPGPETTP